MNTYFPMIMPNTKRGFALVAALLTLVFALPANGLAQQPSFKASGPKVVAIGEQFQVSWEIDAKGQNFQPPALSDFMTVQGPSQGSSSNISLVNGKYERIDKYTFSYILAAKTEGKFQLSPASIEVNGKKIQSNSIAIEVVKGQSGLRNDAATATNAPSGVSDDDVYVRVELSRTEVFQGEQIVATLKVYSRTDQIQFIDAKFPAFDGFYTSEVGNQPNQLARENVNGEIFFTGVFRKLILLPQKTGTLSIEPFEVTTNVNVPAGYARDFFGRTVPRYKTMTLNLKSKTRSVTVKPLPGNKPDDFSGAVGQYTLSASVDKTEAKTNDAIAYKLTLKGKGNIKLVEPFKIKFPGDFDSFDPKVEENITVDNSGSSGTKVFEYLLIPRYAGEFKIPSVSFSYFDVSESRYVTLSTQAFDLKIEKGLGDENVAMIQGTVGKKGVQMIGKDIRFIKNETELNASNSYFFGSAAFWLLLILPFFVLLALLIWHNRRLKESANIGLMKNRRASAHASKRLREAGQNLKSGNQALFYESILNALYGFFSDKLLIPFASLNRENLMNGLKDQSIDESMITEVNSLLDLCEFARYAPGIQTEENEQVFSRVRQIIVDLDRKIKLKK